MGLQVLSLTGALLAGLGGYQAEKSGVSSGLGPSQDSYAARARPRVYGAGVQIRDRGVDLAQDALSRAAVAAARPGHIIARASLSAATGIQRVANKPLNIPSLILLQKILAQGNLNLIATDTRYNLPYLCAHETDAVIRLLTRYPHAYPVIMQNFLGDDVYDFLTNPQRCEPLDRVFTTRDAAKLLAAVKLVAAFEPRVARLAVRRLSLQLMDAGWPGMLQTGFGIKLDEILSAMQATV